MGGIKRTAADKRFSDFIRDRDNWTCQRCGAVKEPHDGATLHTMHNFSRACKRCTTKNPKPHYCTRLDPSNALAGCYGCHQFIDSHPQEKERLFRLRHGNAEYDRLAAIHNERRDRV
jgi:hypothetical protein